MKTIVFQSFRTENVPGWIARCMTSVQDWAKARGFEYRFWGDEFFEFVPLDLRPRASAHKCVLSDFARLVAAKQLLSEGYDRAIWVDADALVFDPDNFTINLESGYSLCREVWLDRTVLGRPQFRLTVNNSVSVFCQDETLIDFYLEVARSILAGSRPIGPLSIGTEVLLGLRRAVNFPLLTTVGIFGAEMAYRYLKEDGRFLAPYLRFQTSPVYAVNLCLSHHNKVFRFSGAREPWTLNEQVLNTLLNELLKDRGAALNRWFSAGYTPKENEFLRPLSSYLAIKEDLKTLVGTLRRG